MTITRPGSPATKRGPADWFTGTVWIDDLAAGATASGVRALRVTFEPGARTAWHTHPHGQVLHILAGVARVQRVGEAVVEVHPGDTVWFEPGERHWHGAAPGRLMAHLAIQHVTAGEEAATWFEHVTDTEYNLGNG